MSVNATTYTMFGVSLPYDDAFTDAFYSSHAYDALDDCVVIDGMSGEYMVIGKKLFDSSETPEGFQVIDEATLPAAKAEVRERFAEVLPAHADLLENPWQLMTFVHYS